MQFPPSLNNTEGSVMAKIDTDVPQVMPTPGDVHALIFYYSINSRSPPFCSLGKERLGRSFRCASGLNLP